jgi:hypothetical protein
VLLIVRRGAVPVVAAGAVLLAALGGAVAAAPDGIPVVPKDPPQGSLHRGEQVLVDDGSCPAGQIKLVTGGSDRSYYGAGTRPGAARTGRCVPHQP